MAKRRTSSGSRTKSASRGAGGSWKKSKGLAIGLVVVILIVWIWMIKSLLVGPSREPLLKNFPYQYMTEKTFKLIEIRADSDKQPKLPFKDEATSEYVWEAWVCNNPKCPWLQSSKNKEKKPLVFPHVVEYLRKVAEGTIDPAAQENPEGGPPPGMESYEDMPQCPACKAKGEEPYQVERYNSDEGKQMLEELRKKFEEKRKEGGN